VFVSILVHELGHALAFRRFGADAEIVLYAFGGLAVSRTTVSGRWRRIVVSLAGPFAGFALCAAVFGASVAFPEVLLGSPLAAFAAAQLVFVNLYWNLLNLLPVFPLDGGQVSRELCTAKWGHRGTKVSLKVSFATALAIVGWSLFCEIDTGQLGTGVTRDLPWWVPRGSMYIAILFGLLAYESYQLLQRIEWTDTHWDDRLPWER
jgi:Zn-dependent protease